MNRSKYLKLCFLLVGVVGFFAAGEAVSDDFDILITDAKIVDGTGNPWFYGDIGIRGDTIAEIGRFKERKAGKTIDARGLFVSPGFIDLHTHCDFEMSLSGSSLNLNYLTQGVTTVVVGNCGSGTFKIKETKEKWEKQGMGTNAVMLVGFGTVRTSVLGVENRAPSPEELEEMKATLGQAMKEGAWGMSTGLQYIPDRYASTEEVIALTHVVGKYGGIYTSHQRDEEEELAEAVKETIRIGEETRVPVNAAHLKAAGKGNWGLMEEAVRQIDEARARGVEITADMYPYDKAATTPLIAIFNVPPDLQPLRGMAQKLLQEEIHPEERLRMLGQVSEELARALQDEEKREKIKKITLEGDPGNVNWVKTWGWHNFTIVGAEKNKNLIGKVFSDLALEQGREPFDISADLFLEEQNNLIISLGAMSEDDMMLAMKKDWLMFSSDGSAVPYKRGPVHPRNYGSFPRVLRKYVREDKILTLEQAVRKMSSLPAHVLRMKDRGLLLEGYKADLVIFDAQTIRDNATYLDPHQYSSGIVCVLVNGQLSIEKGQWTRALSGRALLLTNNQ